MKYSFYNLRQLALCIILSASYSKFAGAAETADPAFQKLSSSLIELRLEIEEISDQIEANSDLYKSRLQSANIKKADLSASVQREDLAVKQLEEQRKELNIQWKSLAVSDTGELDSVLELKFSELRAYIDSSLPFMKTKRLESLASLESELKAKKLSTYKLAMKLWAFMEDEKRLHSDVGLYKQVIEYEGEQQLVELVKIGMMVAYFRNPNGDYAQISRDETGSWQITPVEDSSELAALTSLFEQQEKQIRYGYFELPKFF